MDIPPVDPIQILVIGASQEMSARLREQFRAAGETGLVVVDYQQIEDRIIGKVSDNFDIAFFDDLGDGLTPRKTDYTLRRRREEEMPILLSDQVPGKPKHNNGKGMRDRWGRVHGRYR